MSKFNMRAAKRREGLLILITFICFAAVIVRLFWLQIVQADALAERMQYQTTGTVVKHAPRGAIVDCNGEELAVSIMTKSLIAEPNQMHDNPQKGNQKPTRNVKRLAADLIGEALHLSPNELYADFKRDSGFMYVKRTMDAHEARLVADIIKQNKLPGLRFEEESKRYYTKKSMAAQVLGFVGTDDKGLSGLELALDPIITGAEAQQPRVIDAHANTLLIDGAEIEYPSDMPTVYLTIDSKIQFALENALDVAIQNTKAAAAAVILMDPNTGAILGMASRPTFDPNRFDEYPAETWKNRGVSVIYEPGSVFKPIVGCMGLTEQLITPQTLINDEGRIQIADRIIRNWDNTGKGLIPFEDVIKYSINTGMVQLGMELGAKRMIEYSKSFGFGAATEVELPGEEEGILYKPEDMYKPDIATMSIGQGIAVTPLQMLRAICAIANGGELLQPYIIDKIVMPDGRVLRQGQKHVVRNVVSSEVAAQMRSMMEKVVSEGGGKPAYIPGYRIAGKTGTAEKLSEQGGYAAGKYIASFVGFVPADKPQYAMLVMLDTPQGAFYGSQVSAPVFKDTLQQILVAKGVQPSTHVGLPSFEQHGAKAPQAQAAKVPVLEFTMDGKVKIPDFTGLDMRQTAELVQRGHLVLVPNGSGKAYKQSIKPGTIASDGTKIEIWFQ